MSELGKIPQAVINLLIVTCIGAVVFTVLAIPQFQDRRQNARARALHDCVNNLRQIDAAKQQWAMENQKETNAIPTITDVAPYLKNNQFPVCPTKGKYTIGHVADDPICSISGHVLPPP